MSKAIARISIILVVFSIIAVSLVGVYTSALVSSSPSISSSVSIASLPTRSLSQNSTSTISNSTSSSLLTNSQRSESSYNSSTSSSSVSSQKNLTALVLLNNLVQSPTVYRISEAEEIESWSNATTTGIMIWSVNHTTSITINSTTMYVEPHFNCRTMRTFGTLIHWPVFAIYNWPIFHILSRCRLGTRRTIPSTYG